MGIIDKLKNKKVIERLSDEYLYEIVHKELSNNITKDGLWAKAIAESRGDYNTALAVYINLRKQSLRDELYLVNQLEHVNTTNYHVTRDTDHNITTSDNAELTDAPIGWLIIGVVIIAIIVAAGLFIGL
jgi:hypothetical protein